VTEVPETDALSHKLVRHALARAAYQDDTVRLVCSDLSDADCLVTSRHGVFAVSRSGARLLIYGLFFGIAVDGCTLYLFEACDKVRAGNNLGRIVRFRIEDRQLKDPHILCKGLDNGCHQIAVINEELVVVDTYRQLLQRYDLSGQLIDQFDPVARAKADDSYAAVNVHMNSIGQLDDKILLLLHRGNTMPAERSEILVFTTSFQFAERYGIDGYGCHDIVVLEDRTLLHCGSLDGELIGSNGLKRKISGTMTRGLAYDARHLMIGASPFAERGERMTLGGEVIYLDRDFQRRGAVAVDGAPTGIVSLEKVLAFSTQCETIRVIDER